jgi:tetratricopeptide (TPR) repeat protein
MTDVAWYRQTRWTPEIAAEFDKRLSKSRGSRSEYLRVQALTLSDTEICDYARPAIDLAQRHLELAPEGIGAAQMQAAIAKAFSTLGDTDAAIDAYRRSVELERLRPNVRGYRYIDFAWFAATRGLTAVYDEALAAMERNMDKQDLIFPENQYRYFGALAIISSDQGDNECAERMAKNAIVAASAEKGPFGHLPSLGLVNKPTDEIYARMRRLAG